MRIPNYEEFSDEQILIAKLPKEGKFLVLGAAGTGKTVLAMYKMIQDHCEIDENGKLSPKKRGILNFTLKSIDNQFLMYNRLLRNYVHKLNNNYNHDFEVNTWHYWIYKVYKTVFDKIPPQEAQYRYKWDILKSDLTSNKMKKIPNLIIDEAQDFPFELIEILFRNSSNVLMFGDPNQSINETRADCDDFSKAGFENQFYLTKNFRNTLEIYNVAKLFIDDGVAAPIRRGSKPTLLKAKNRSEVVTRIANHARNNPNWSIGVLIPTLSGKTIPVIEEYYYELKKEFDQTYMYHSELDDKGRISFKGSSFITVCSFRSMKGLEFDSIFIIEIDDDYFESIDDEIKKELYVGITRAKNSLTFVSFNGDSEVVRILKHSSLIDEEEFIENDEHVEF